MQLMINWLGQSDKLLLIIDYNILTNSQWNPVFSDLQGKPKLLQEINQEFEIHLTGNVIYVEATVV